jgi:hypothetical protein
MKNRLNLKEGMNLRNNKRHYGVKQGIAGIMAAAFMLACTPFGSAAVYAGTGNSTGDTDTDAIAITVLVPPKEEKQPAKEEKQPAKPITIPATASTPSPAPTPPPKLFPINVIEGYNEEGTRQVVRVYELLNNESPDWIDAKPFSRNGYHYEIAEITREVDIEHTTREHTEVVEVPSSDNDLAAVIASLDPFMDFEDADGYVGRLALDVQSISMTQDGTRTSSRAVNEIREYPYLSSPDIALIPGSITSGGRTYTLGDVIPIPFSHIPSFGQNASPPLGFGFPPM